MEIKLTKSSLTTWKHSYKEALIKQANNPKIAQFLRDAFPQPYTEKDALSWVDLNQKMGIPLNFAILVDGEFAGCVGIDPKEDIFRCNAEIGYWLGESYWGQGIMTEVVLRMVEYTFKTLEITRLYAGVFENNLGSMKILERADFVLEAIIKKGVIKNGLLYDEHIYSIIR